MKIDPVRKQLENDLIFYLRSYRRVAQTMQVTYDIMIDSIVEQLKQMEWKPNLGN